LLVAVAAAALLVASDIRPSPEPHARGEIVGPFASLLDASTDLGPARGDHVQLTAALSAPTQPTTLIEWARTQGLSARWRPGDDWAIIEGTPAAVAESFDVEVHDYRGKRGQEFYASPQQPQVPTVLAGEVTELGRILSYTPHHMSRPDTFPLDVPNRGLSPTDLLNTYNADDLARAGFTGKGQTIVIFAFDGFDQTDLDTFSTQYGLPRFTPEVVGGDPGRPRGELTMDLEVAHAIAPDATKVVVNARPTVEGDGAYEKIGQLFESVDRQFPGAVWSLSIGWGCDALLKAADLAPVEGALATAQKHGTSAFDASGDTASLECKGGDEWASPPGPDDIGLDAISSLPAMTSVGGTTLSTDQNGGWMGERAWVDSPLSQGTSGGVSALFNRPAWQRNISVERDIKQRRLAPDVSAVADPFTGVRIVFNQQDAVGAGTSQAAPIWAALTVLMNQYLVANGGHQLGNINPLLYRVAAGANRPAFRDISFGGNAVDLSQPGYDMVTGLGSPNVDFLVRDLLEIQRGVAPR
jgi:kumamolisin